LRFTNSGQKSGRGKYESSSIKYDGEWFNDKKEGKNENDGSVCKNSFIILMRVFYTVLYICIKQNDHESAIEKVKPNRLPG